MKTDRLLSITLLLLENKQMTAKQLADHFEVSKRTIYRDLDSLLVSGIPLYTEVGVNGGIYIDPQFKLDHQTFNKEDLVLLLSAIKNQKMSNV